MRSRSPWRTPIFSLTVVLTTVPVSAVEVQKATEAHAGKPLLWQDYEPVHRDVVACIAGSEKMRLTDSICDRAHQLQAQMLWDAINQVALLNASPSGKGAYWSPQVIEIIAKQNRADGITVATYSIESQLNGGTGPYGSDLPNTELRRIVFDGLVKANPCNPR